MRSRVVMLVSNACVNDTRVIRAAETLAEKGFDTIVLAKSDDYRTSEEWRNGVHYKRLGKPSFAVRSLPAKAADPIIPPFERLLQYLKEREPALSLLRTLATLIRSLAQPLRRYPSRTSRKVYRTTVRAYYRLNRYAAAFDSTLTLRSRPIRRAHYRARNFFSRLIGRIRAVRKTIRAVGKTFVISRLNFLLCRPLVHARRMRQLFGPDLINLKPDIIHAHDLVTLPAGSAAAKVVGAKLIYDAHELEVHRNTKAGTVDRWLRYYLERKHIRKCDAVITVCDSIADHIAREYSVDRPVVVMNAPDVGRDVVCEASLRSSLGLSSEMPLIVYVGRITVGRGIEQIVEAMQYLPGYHLALVGPKNKPTVEEAQIKAQALRLYDRLHIVDPVPRPSSFPSFALRTSV